ncbi:MAG: hypothetical protein V4617_08075 [Gemmatimonadota bacterium]
MLGERQLPLDVAHTTNAAQMTGPLWLTALVDVSPGRRHRGIMAGVSPHPLTRELASMLFSQSLLAKASEPIGRSLVSASGGGLRLPAVVHMPFSPHHLNSVARDVANHFGVQLRQAPAIGSRALEPFNEFCLQAEALLTHVALESSDWYAGLSAVSAVACTTGRRTPLTVEEFQPQLGHFLRGGRQDYTSQVLRG